MKMEMKLTGALRLTSCNYGLSKVNFRGPLRPTTGRYVAFLGGSDTFAKYIERPFPDLIEDAVGEVCVNLGCQSAGPDVFLRDTAIQSLCHDAAVTVIQIVGAVNQSNAFYKVHPRRNDRFIAPTPKLRALFPEIDFTEISFTGHLIKKLRAVDMDRFAQIQSHLQHTWVRRMKTLIGQAGSSVVLLWLDAGTSKDALCDPVFVTEKMVEELRPYAAKVIKVEATTGNTLGKCFAPLDELAAREAMDATTHVAVAEALHGPLRRGLG